MSKGDRYISASELMKKLEQNPEYLAKKAKKEAAALLRAQKYAEAELPFLEKLRLNGFSASSIIDMIKQYAPLPPSLITIILDSLDDTENDLVREWLIRALAAAKERFDGSKLTTLYDKTQNITLQWVILNTIAVTNPHSINEWITKNKENYYIRTNLDKLKYKWPQ